mgnify:CR=1 FL=1
MTKDIINLLFGFFLMQYFAGDEKSIILVVILSLVLILNLISIVFDHLNKVFNKDLWNSVMVILYGIGFILYILF